MNGLRTAAIGSPPPSRLDPVEEVVVVNAMSGQRALASPPVNGLLGYVQQASDLSHFQVHGVCLL